MMPACKRVATKLALASVLAFSVSSQDASRDSDEVKRISGLIDQAWKEVKAAGTAAPAGARANDSPGRKYSAILWQYHADHPRTAAGGRAVVAALNLLLAVGDTDRAAGLSKQIQPDDPAWDRLIQILWRESERTGEYAPFLERAKQVLGATSDRNVRARVGIFMGLAYWKQDRLDLAKAAFDQVANVAPQSDDADWARGNIHEIESLNPGQPAPALDAQTLHGDHISISKLQGRVVLLKFWATW